MVCHKKSGLAVLAWGLSVGWALLLAPPASADQIVAITDARGHKVYVNIGDPMPQAHRRVSRSFRPSFTPNSTLPYEEVDRLVNQTAGELQVDPRLLHAIIRAESEYDPNAVSAKGAMGLMQLVPSTALRFGVENPFDPKQNIQGGAAYLKYLLNLFGGNLPLSLAAYNAGENSVLRRGGIPPFNETQNYVRKVRGFYAPRAAFEAGSPRAKEPYKAPIFRYVDSNGVIHFTNGDEF